MYNLATILSQFPAFKSLSKSDCEELAKISRLKEYSKGQAIYRENDPPAFTYILISGRVKTYTQSSKQTGQALEYLYKGTCFGIISLLTGQAHSITTEAANDCLIIEITNSHLSGFLQTHPHLFVEFTKMLSKRVQKKAHQKKSIFSSVLISVYSPSNDKDLDNYALSLAKALQVESGKKVLLLKMRSGEKDFSGRNCPLLRLEDFNESSLECADTYGWGFDSLGCVYQKQGQDEQNVSALLSFLAQNYNFIVADLPQNLDPDITSALRQSDKIHLFSKADLEGIRMLEVCLNHFSSQYKIDPSVYRLILQTGRSGSEISKLKLNLSDSALSKSGLLVIKLPQETEVIDFIKDYPKGRYHQTVRTVAREISNMRIGLALGSGAAFGFAHLGVLEVLKEQNIDVDIIAGTSMGAIIAALWAGGKPIAGIKETLSAFKSFNAFSLWELAFSKTSFLKGKRFERIIKKIFKDTAFEDLLMPALIVSFDFKKRESHVFSQGPNHLWKAVLASCSIPGIFEPLQDEETFLFDGGILNPLPAGALVKAGVKKIISVNITPSRQEIRKSYETGNAKKNLNVFDFIFGSIEAMQQRFIEEALSLSDVIIHPEFNGALWTNFKNMDFFIQQGRKATLDKLPELKTLVEA